jgi:3-oxoacyl-[acyl-carrier-protein] synthase-3
VGLEEIFKSRDMKHPTSRIADIAGYASEWIVPNLEIEKKINATENLIGPGSIERLFGVKERRYANHSDQVSDLAVLAAIQILSRIDRTSIDCLIFAAASSDLIEPATANIIQSKLGLTCAAFDVKNACNSFVTALHVANAFIVSGQLQKDFTCKW